MTVALYDLDMDADGVPLGFRSGLGIHMNAVLGLARILTLAGTAIEEGHGADGDGEAVRIMAECIEAHAQRATWLYVRQEEAETSISVSGDVAGGALPA